LNSVHTRRMVIQAGKRLAVLFLLAIVCSCGVGRKLDRVWRFNLLFDEDTIVRNFRSMSDFCPHHVIHKGEAVYAFAEDPRDLPEKFEYQGKIYQIKDLLASTWTTGLIIIH